MTDYEVVLRTNIIFLVSGIVLRALAIGDWMNLTEHLDQRRIGLMIVAWLMMIFGIIGMMSMIAGSWGVVIAVIVLCFLVEMEN